MRNPIECLTAMLEHYQQSDAPLSLDERQAVRDFLAEAPHVHLARGGRDGDAKVYSARDVEALIAVCMAVAAAKQPKRYTCTLCGGEVDLANAIAPSATAGPGGRRG